MTKLTPENLANWHDDIYKENKNPIDQLILWKLSNEQRNSLEFRQQLCDALNYHAEKVQRELEDKLLKIIEVGLDKTFVPMKNKDGEELVQRVGHNAAGSKKHEKTYNRICRYILEELKQK